jgi:hypothetical protein
VGGFWNGIMGRCTCATGPRDLLVVNALTRLRGLEGGWVLPRRRLRRCRPKRKRGITLTSNDGGRLSKPVWEEPQHRPSMSDTTAPQT